MYATIYSFYIYIFIYNPIKHVQLSTKTFETDITKKVRKKYNLKMKSNHPESDMILVLKPSKFSK